MTPFFTFQELIFRLKQFWMQRGYTIAESFDRPIGAGTSHPLTFFSSLHPYERVALAYVQPSSRPADGRYGENPFRLQHYYQFQVLTHFEQEAPLAVYLQSLSDVFGLTRDRFDINFIEDNWENPSLGAAGLGWEVRCNGMEISQITYFQQMGGFPANRPIELTYGLERLALLHQRKGSLFDILWSEGLAGPVTYGALTLGKEREESQYYFDGKDSHSLMEQFQTRRAYGESLLAGPLPSPYSAYLEGITLSHLFNVLDTRGVMGIRERKRRLLEIRAFFHQVAASFLAKIEANSSKGERA